MMFNMLGSFIMGMLAPQRRHTPAPVAMAEVLEGRLILSAGQLDPSFGSSGTAFGQLFPGGVANASALQSDGKIIVAGTTSQGFGRFALARFNRDGSLDRTFGHSGRVVDSSAGLSIEAIAVQPNGDIVAAGESGGPDSPAGFTVVRYLPAGTRDSAFGSDGIATLYFFHDRVDANSVAIQPDGAIVAGGDAFDPSGGGRENFALARLTSAGVPDQTFGNGGTVTTFIGSYGGSINSVLLQPDGKIIAAGEDAIVTGRLVFARYNADGSLDNSFGAGGIFLSDLSTLQSGPSNHFHAALLPNGEILAPTVNQNYGLGLARFTASGNLDTAFGTGGVAFMNPSDTQASVDGPGTILVQQDGRIIEVGTSVTGVGAFSTSGVAVARFTPNGAADATFGSEGLVESPLVGSPIASGALLRPDGRIVVTGTSYIGSRTDSELSSDFALARFMPNGQLDSTFGYHGAAQQPNGFTGNINAVAVQADGKILTAGSELAPDPSKWTDAAIARYNPDGSLDTSFGVDGRFYIRIGNDAVFKSLLIQPDGKILAGGSGEVGGTPQYLLVRLYPDGTYDHSFDGTGVAQLGFAGFQRQSIADMAFAPGGKIVVGGTATDPTGTDAFSVARYLPNGRLDPTFAYGGRIAGHPLGMPSEESALAVAGNGDIILAGSIGGMAGMVRLDDRGRYNTSFGNGGVVQTPLTPTDYQWGISAIALDPLGNIVAGGGGVAPIYNSDNQRIDSFINGPSFLARYTPTGTLDPSFGTGGLLTNGPDLLGINTLALQADGKIVAGGLYFGNYQNLPTPPNPGDEIVARFDAQGFDATFGDNGIADLVQTEPPSIGTSNFSSVPIRGLAIQPDGKILAGAFDLFRLLRG